MQISSFNDTYSSYYDVQKSSQKEPLKVSSPAKEEEEKAQETAQEKKLKEKQDPNKLTPEQEEQVKKLQKRDTEVRAHEAAHIAAGGGVVTGGASFTYQKGPDGRSYAVGGEVPIDMSTESTPEATISKMQKVRVAALAPADPSPQDYKVASTATILEMQARVELSQENAKEASENSNNPYDDSRKEESEEENEEKALNLSA